jgi:predicted nucleic acid-binding protein
MRRIFADSHYWIALAYSRDQWHGRAMKVTRPLRGVVIVTTEEVLTEFLTAFRYSATLRQSAARMIARIQGNPKVLIRPQSHQSFLDGLALYIARSDKQYSLTDCTSMEAMRQEGIVEILTHDIHFRQEGFTILL